MVFLCIAAACRDASAWPEPDSFDPERFTRPDTAKAAELRCGHPLLPRHRAGEDRGGGVRARRARPIPAAPDRGSGGDSRGARCLAAARLRAARQSDSGLACFRRAARPRRVPRRSRPRRRGPRWPRPRSSVRSAARKRSASASDLRPSPICGPVYTSNSRTSSSSSPAPSRTASTTSVRRRPRRRSGDVLEHRRERRHRRRGQRLGERDRVEVQLDRAGALRQARPLARRRDAAGRRGRRACRRRSTAAQRPGCQGRYCAARSVSSTPARGR